MSMPAAFAVAILLAAMLLVPPAAAQGGVPGGPCWTLCAVVIAVAILVASCVTGEVDQTVEGQGDGGWCTNPFQDGLACAIEDVKRVAGLGPGCTPV